MGVTLYALGQAEIEVGKTRITPTSAKKFAFLLFLASERGRRVPRAALQELLFPEATEKRAAHALRELLYQLRHAGAPLLTDKARVGLSAEAVRSDFSEVLEAEEIDERRVRAVEGGFLPGYAPSFSRPFAGWLDGYRARMTRELASNLLRRAVRRRDVGEIEEATALARAALAFEPLNEDATLIVAESLALNGAKVQAIELLDAYRRETGLSREMTLPASVLRKRIMSAPAWNYAPRTSVFAGRQPEMASIAEAMRAAEAGEPRIVALTGEPGIGKTRIAVEASNRAALEGWLVVHVRTHPGDQHRPLAAFADVVPKLMNAPGALGCSPDNMQWLRRLIEHDPRTANSGGSHEGVAAAISGAIRDLIDAVASESPVLFVVDDMQWVDRASVRLMREIVGASGSHRVLFLATSRIREANRGLAEQNWHFSSIEVGPLSASDSRSIVESGLRNPQDADLVNWIIEAGHGNAFFLESLTRHLDETGERFVVPARVAELMDQRIKGLSRDDRHVLSTIVRLGRRSSLSRLRNAVGLPHFRFAQSISQLERDGLIRIEDVVRPNHWLVAESDSRLMTPIASRVLHARIAEILRKDLEEHADSSLLWDLSEHYLAAGDHSQAAEALARCAQFALSVGRVRDASELYERAASLVEQESTKGRLLVDAIRCATAASEADIVLRIGKSLDHLGTELPSDTYIARVTAALGNQMSTVGELARLRSLFTSLTNSLPERMHAARLFLIACDQERVLQPIVMARDDLQALWLASDPDDSTALRLRLIFEALAGEQSTIAEIAERMLRTADRLRPDIATDVRRNAAIGLNRAGQLERSIALWTSAFNDATRLGLMRTRYSLALMLAHAMLEFGDDAAADRWYEVACGHPEVHNNSAAEFLLRAFSADASFARRDEARFTEVSEWVRANRIKSPSARLRRWYSCVALYAAHLGGSESCAAMARGTLNDMEPEFEFGDVGDLSVAVAARILSERGRIPEGRGIIDQYLRDYRRKMSPLSAPLQMVLQELGVRAPKQGPAAPRAFRPN